MTVNQTNGPIKIGSGPTIRQATINSSTGAISNYTTGSDLMVSSVPTSAGPDQQFIASKVWSSVYGDFADFRTLDDELVYGKCYYKDSEGVKICNEECQMGLVGIASDTFGSSVGSDITGSKPRVPISVAGWVLAYVDKAYSPGTPLTNDANGNLTEMDIDQKLAYPERLVATYDGPEPNEYWGPSHNRILVDGRHWVKIV